MKWSSATTRSAPRRSHSKLNAPSHAPMSSTVLPGQVVGQAERGDLGPHRLDRLRAGRDDAVTEVDRVPPPVAHRGDGRLDAGARSLKPVRVARRRPPPVGSGGVWPVASPSPGTGSSPGSAGGSRAPRRPGPVRGSPRPLRRSAGGRCGARWPGRAPRPRGPRRRSWRSGPARAPTAAVSAGGEVHAGAPRLAHALGDRLGLAAEHAEARPRRRRCRRRGCGRAGRRPRRRRPRPRGSPPPSASSRG